MRRDEQYPTDESTLYVSTAAEAPLDGSNPFKRGSADEPMTTDPDAAAVSAVLGRDSAPLVAGTLRPNENSAKGDIVPRTEENQLVHNSGNDGDLNGRTSEDHAHEKDHGDKSRIAPLFRPEEKPRAQPSPNDDTEENDDNENEDRGPGSERRPSLKHSRNSPAVAESEEITDSDPEVRRVRKRARRDSRSLLVEPGDNAEEEERKMRANHDLRGVVGGGEEPGDQEEETRGDTKDDVGVSYTKGVEPTTTNEGLLKPQGSDPATTEDINEVDGRCDDDDVEAKQGDDYDVENYAEFEDDDDDTENLDPGERLV